MNLITPLEYADGIKKKLKPQWKAVFLAVVITGLMIHMPALLSDIPNHDGLDSMYFDQNMITSGRWFLMIACGISSFYNIPWLIGILGIFYLACTGVLLIEVLGIRDHLSAALTGMLLVSFPALASTFAYVFTLDGYMMGMLLTVFAVYCVKRWRAGFLFGGVSLAFGMGIYQAYLPFAVVLSMYCVLVIFAGGEKEDITQKTTCAGKIKKSLPYLYMGGIGVLLYEVILHVLLLVQGKELDTYQGINGAGSVSAENLPTVLFHAFRDFFAFTLKGKILFNNVFSAAAFWVLLLCCLIIAGKVVITKKWWKKPVFFIIMFVTVFLLPVVMNLILIVSPQVNYHLLMRYQWVLLPILAVAFAGRHGREKAAVWGIVISAFVLVFCYAVTDNIAYNNLQKKYEKTYAYCLRVLDRIEQTKGYYQGIPVALVGVVGSEQFPKTDITQDVTDPMIGMSGDYLLYTSANYEKFMKYYLGATLNFVPVEKMGEIYYTAEYEEMESFPGETSVKIINGVLCVKTENTERN